MAKIVSSKPLNKYNAVAVTTGDPDGIGFEVTAKALYKIGPQKNICFFIFRDHKQELLQKKYFDLIDKKFSRFTFKSLKSALAFFFLLKQTHSLNKKFIFDLELESSAADWVIDSTLYCKDKVFSSLVTAPLSKTLIKKSGYDFIGHTGIFRHYFPQNELFMGFVGKYFNVLLTTDHVRLQDVETHLNKKILKHSKEAALNFKKLLKSKKPIALLGLNPHAGEKGLMGEFESKTLSPVFKNQFAFSKPLPPDAAFLKENWSKYAFFLCQYHDQGLIPFKMIHGQDSGVHITLGLPFIRTSVDHGTAKDIYNKNLANPNSMIDAIKLNLKLIN
ncbi:MAG: PdxA family protein [Pseudobdellovibrio sp.]